MLPNSNNNSGCSSWTKIKGLMSKHVELNSIFGFAVGAGWSYTVEYFTKISFSGMVLKMRAPVALAATTFGVVKRGVEWCLGNETAFQDIRGEQCAHPVLYGGLDIMNQVTYAYLSYPLYSKIDQIQWVGAPLRNIAYNFVSENASSLIRRYLFDSFKPSWKWQSAVIIATTVLGVGINFFVVLREKPGEVANEFSAELERIPYWVYYVPTVAGALYKVARKVYEKNCKPDDKPAEVPLMKDWIVTPMADVVRGLEGKASISETGELIFEDERDRKEFEAQLAAQVVLPNVDSKPSASEAKLPDLTPKPNPEKKKKKKKKSGDEEKLSTQQDVEHGASSNAPSAANQNRP